MTLSPLFSAVPPIPGHAIAAFAAILLAAVQVLGPKGSTRHRIFGWAFVIAMGYVAISAIFIWEIRLWGRWSPIHLIIPVTLWSLYASVRAARAGDVKRHRNGMISIVVTALLITGAFTFLPGRIMHEVFFGPLGATQ